MVSTDPIADMLTRIRNAINVHKNEISLPHSGVKEAIARILKENNFIDEVSVKNAAVGKTMILKINDASKNARITEIVRLSTPGRRFYSKSAEIPTVKQGRGLVVVSTSQGMMSGDQAKQQHIGGELICRIY